MLLLLLQRRLIRKNRVAAATVRVVRDDGVHLCKSVAALDLLLEGVFELLSERGEVHLGTVGAVERLAQLLLVVVSLRHIVCVCIRLIYGRLAIRII